MSRHYELTILGLAATYVLAAAFAVSAGVKLRALDRFILGLRRYEIFSQRAVPAISVFVVLSEACIAISLFSGFARTYALVAASALLAAFLSVAIRNVRADEPLPCYCFSMRDDEVHPIQSLIRTGLLLIVTVVVTLVNQSGQEAERSASNGNLEALLLAIATLVLFNWLMHMPEVLALYKIRSPRILPAGQRISLRGAPLSPRANDDRG